MTRKIQALKCAIPLIGLISSFSITHSALANGGTFIPESGLPIMVVLKGAWATESRPGIKPYSVAPFTPFSTRAIDAGAGFVGTTYIATQNLLTNNSYTGLNDTSRFNSFSPGIEFWTPVFEERDVTFNAGVFGDYIAGTNVSATNTQQTTVNTFNAPSAVAVGVPSLHTSTVTTTNYNVSIKTGRLNIGVGVNGFYNFEGPWFVEGMLGGGITRYQARAQWTTKTATNTLTNEALVVTPPGAVVAAVTNNTNGTTFVGAADHPGAVSTRPFIQAEVGLGRQISARSKIYGFVSGGWSQPNSMSLESPNSAFVSFNAPHNWYKVGVAITRNFTL